MGGKTLEPKNFGVEYSVNGGIFQVDTCLADSTGRVLWALGVYILSRNNCIFGNFQKFGYPKCTQSGQPLQRSILEIINPKFRLVIRDWTNLWLSRAGIAIFFSNSWGKIILPILEIGGIPRTSQVKYLRNGYRYENKTRWLWAHYESPHFVFFQDFPDGGLGNPVTPKYFLTNF